MKKITSFGLAVLLVFVCCSCSLIESDNLQEGSTTLKQNNLTKPGEITEDATVEGGFDDTPLQTVSEKSYLTAAVAQQMSQYFSTQFSDFAACGTGGAPYAIQDVFGLSNLRLTSITIPVYKVGTADENGNYVFSVHVVKNSYEGLKENVLRTYKVLVNASENGLQNNSTVGKLIKVDVSAADIVLSENETLAFFSTTDTVIPAYISKADSAARIYLSENCPWAVGFFSKVGTKNLGFSSQVLYFDFKYEIVTDIWENTANEYQQLVTSLKDKYQGKYVSVIGDSISTFGGYSNNTDYNSTIGDNEVYYPDTLARLASWQHTYWGRLIKDLDMKLCVNNSRSGKTVYGVPALQYADSAMFRATELDNDNGTPNDPSDDIAPEVILFYMGINDTTIKSPFGDLYDLLKDANESEYNQIVDTWFKAVLTKTNNGANIVQGTTITSFEQAYAMSLYKMQQKYPGVEIFCLNLVRNDFTAPELIEKYNVCIQACAEYFGAILVNQNAESGINENTNHAYNFDVKCLHPNALGFYLMTKTIMNTWLRRSIPLLNASVAQATIK